MSYAFIREWIVWERNMHECSCPSLGMVQNMSGQVFDKCHTKIYHNSKESQEHWPQFGYVDNVLG